MKEDGFVRHTPESFEDLEEDQRLAKRAIMEKLGADDQFLLLSTRIKNGLRGLVHSDYSITDSAVVRFGADEVVAFQIAHFLNEDEDVSRLLRQLNDEMRPDCIVPWTMEDHLGHISSSAQNVVEKSQDLPPKVREALKSLMQLIADHGGGSEEH